MYKKLYKFIENLEDINNNLDDYNSKEILKNQKFKDSQYEKRKRVANESGFETVEDFDQAIEDLNDEIFGTHSKRKWVFKLLQPKFNLYFASYEFLKSL